MRIAAGPGLAVALAPSALAAFSFRLTDGPGLAVALAASALGAFSSRFGRLTAA
ncbi:MAG TPA: hypothetical protein VFC19_29835 [Candidatus Limnocylindrales bacterium]|nr:hypothetical protein [Candidatus Limnocylindrales bacterium]